MSDLIERQAEVLWERLRIRPGAWAEQNKQYWREHAAATNEIAVAVIDGWIARAGNALEASRRTGPSAAMDVYSGEIRTLRRVRALLLGEGDE